MPQNLYESISLVTSSVMLVLFFVLVFLRSPKRREWRHFRLATRLIAIACLVLSFSYMSPFLPADTMKGDADFLESIIMLYVGCYQALLFTITSIILVRPTAMLWRKGIRHVLGITCVAMLSIVAYWMLPAWRLGNVILGGVAYLSYIIFLTLYFHRSFHQSVQHLEDLYADDMQLRLRWVRAFFYGALGVGVFALLAALVPSMMLKHLFNVSVPIYYTYVTINLVNYVSTSSFVVKTFVVDSAPAIEPILQEEPCIAPVAVGEVERAIDSWVGARRYADANSTVDEIVAELHISKSDFNAYFKNVLHTQFRTWRRELRIREAMRMMDASPSLSITELMAEVGYKDRSNFYKDFQQIAGMTLKEYRDNAVPVLAKNE